MKQDFLKNMPINKTKKYQKPCMIVMSGLPGSGKTHLAKQLAKELQIFLLSNDYIRNYYYFYQLNNIYSPQKIEQLVKQINLQRLMKIFITHTPFIWDASFHQLNTFQKFEQITSLLKYELITIKINTQNDEQNISRIRNRKTDYTTIDSDIIGDNVEYSTSFPKEAYNEIKKNKKIEIPNEFFDYSLNNNQGLETFNQQIRDITTDIKTKKLTLK